MLYHGIMKRTQIQLDELTFERVRERAFRERISIAEVIRRTLSERVSERPVRRGRMFAFSFIGSGRSRGVGSGKISERHDEELAGAFDI
jgi:hypothetical protein